MNNKISIYSRPYPRNKTYFDVIDTALECGIESIEGFNMLDFSVPDTEAAKKIKDYADEKGIKFSCFSVYINLVGDDRRERIEELKGYVDVAQILGSPFIHHTIANAFNEPQNVVPHRELFFKRGIEAVREIYDYAEKKGVKAIYEEQGYVFNGIDGYRKFLEEVDRNVGVVADFANIYQCGGSPLEFIEQFGDKVVHAHIKDIVLKNTNDDFMGLENLDGTYMYESPIGEGCIEIKRAIDLLKSKGYDGYYGVEYGAGDDDSPLFIKGLELIDKFLR